MVKNAFQYNSPVKLTARTPQFHVYDEVLSTKDLRTVWEFMQIESYVSVHHHEQAKVWRLSDGTPLGSTTAVFLERRKASGSGEDEPAPASAARPGRGLSRAYPTHSGIDLVLETIVNNLDSFAELIGQRGRDFHNVSARAFLYPQGTGLSWHEDDVIYSGGYVFYVNPEWNSQWGGELLIADRPEGGGRMEDETITTLSREAGQLKMKRTPIPPFLDNSRQDAFLGKVGMGRYVVPKGNRLVVIAGGSPHMINKVSSSAGDHVRCTIAGFFHCQAD